MPFEFPYQTLEAIFIANPRRFKGKLPTPEPLPPAVRINQPSIILKFLQ